MSNFPIDRNGIRFLVDLPKWADDRAQLQMWIDERENEVVILVIHPEYPPHKYNHAKDEWEPII